MQGAARLLMLVFLAAAAGCGLTVEQRAATTEFGVATATLAQIAGAEFVQSRDDVIAMKRRELALRGGLPREGIDLDGALDVDDALARVEATEALERYGVLLVQLATGSDEAAVRASGDALVRSLSRLRDAGVLRLSDERLGAIGAAVVMAGSAAEQGMRARATRAIAEESAPAVRAVVELIERDFAEQGSGWGAAVVMAGRQLTARIDDVLEDGERGAEVDAAARGLIVEAATERDARMERSARVSAGVREACAELLLAEKDLRRSLENPSAGLEDLDAFVERVAELKRVYRVLAR